MYSSSSSPAIACLVSLAVLCIGAGSAAAQPSATEADAVASERRMGSEQKSLQVEVSVEAARLAQSGSATLTSARRSNWVGRHPVLFGTALGAGAGLILSYVPATGGRNPDPRMALLGAGVGAWGGLIASAVQKSRAGDPVSLGTKIGIAAGALGLVVGPLATCRAAGGCGVR